VIPATLYARWDKGGEFVVCSDESCGTRFAHVRRRADRDGGDYVNFEPGWVYEPGERAWRMSRRVRERIVRGKLPLYRDEPNDGVTVIPAGAVHMPCEPCTELPAVAICYRCRRPMTLDADRLALRLTLSPYALHRRERYRR
jgi:hypothetical protein